MITRGWLFAIAGNVYRLDTVTGVVTRKNGDQWVPVLTALPARLADVPLAAALDTQEGQR